MYVNNYGLTLLRLRMLINFHAIQNEVHYSTGKYWASPNNRVVHYEIIVKNHCILKTKVFLDQIIFVDQIVFVIYNTIVSDVC